ncbi:MAG: type IV pilin accessory protein [Acinetobacter sp.]|mgnify:CR=1 FL=1|jgi:hypothetical protein|nr:MAG: type IV pilin accessory protein [Acinetobacter sp.]
MSKRVKFFLGHLSVSLLVALFAIGMVFFAWYPTPLAAALGVTSLFLILFFVDVVIGPLCSLLLYKEGKKGLKFDLSIIILVQICAFGYGFYTIAQGRPAWIVLDALAFHIVKSSDIDPTYLAQAKPEFQQPSWFKPQFAALNVEQNVSQKNLLDKIPQGSTALNHPMYYMDVSAAKSRMQLYAAPLARLERYNDKKRVEHIAQQYPEANGWFGLVADQQDLVVLINKEQGKVIKIVDLRPWN